MHASSTAITSITPHRDCDWQLHPLELSSLAIVKRPMFVCEACSDLSVMPFSYNLILPSNCLFLAFSASNCVLQLCPILVKCEEVLTLKTLALITPICAPLPYKRPNLRVVSVTISSLPSDSDFSGAFTSVATSPSMSLSAVGLSKLV